MLYFQKPFIQIHNTATSNKWMCGSADVATRKRWIKSADIKCGSMARNNK